MITYIEEESYVTEMGKISKKLQRNTTKVAL